jgi:hypothetical protein
MTLLEDFSYTDPDRLEWKAPKGSVTDGASIPQSAWSIMGGPFEGPYRLAAVIHDAACVRKDRSWEATHLVFYQAMLTAHVDSVKAKIMYAAVYHFGPRWTLTASVNKRKGDATDAILQSLQLQTGSTNSKIQLETHSIDENLSTQQLEVSFIPPADSLRTNDFDDLRKFIEETEATSPGSVTLEQIRNFRSIEPR